MQLKVNRSAMADGIRRVIGAIQPKNPLAVLQNIRMEADVETQSVLLEATDLDLRLEALVKCEVVEGGATTVPAKLFNNAISALADGIVTVKVDDEKAKSTITAGNAKFSLSGIDAKEFPVGIKESGEPILTMEAKEMKRHFKKVSYAQSMDGVRASLCATLMRVEDGSVSFVATDARRLARTKCNGVSTTVKKDPIDYIIPAKTVAEIVRLLPEEGDVSLYLAGDSNSHTVCLVFGSATQKIFAKTIDAVYPNFGQVIPKSEAVTAKVDVERQALIDAVERVSCVSNGEECPSLKITFEGNRIKVSLNGANDASACDEIEAKYDGEEQSMMFNPHYILEPLRTMDEDMVTFNITNTSSPLLINAEDSDNINVVMPLRSH